MIIRELEYPLFCLVPRRLSLHENLRAEEGGKSKAVFLLPMIPFASTLVTRVRTLTCAVLTSQYKQTPFKTLSLLRFVFMNRFPGHKLYMQGILFTNEVCGEILGQNFVYQTQMTLNKRPLCFLFREKSAWFVSCLLFFCFTSSVSSKRGNCQILVV